MPLPYFNARSPLYSPSTYKGAWLKAVKAAQRALSTRPAALAAPTVESAIVADPTVSGTTIANGIVKILVDAVQRGTVTANGSGVWSWPMSPALATGVHAITATVTSPTSGLTSLPSPATTVTAPPAIPDAPTTNSYTSSTPTLRGLTTPGATVVLSDGVTEVATMVAGADGRWSWTAEGDLASGVHAFTVTAAIGAAISDASPATTVTVA